MSWGQIISFEIPFSVMGGQWSIWEALAEKATQNSLGNSVRHLWGYLAARFAGTFAGTLLGQRGGQLLTGHCTGRRRKRSSRRRRRSRSRRRRLHISIVFHFKLPISTDFSWRICLERHISRLIWRTAQCLGLCRPFRPFWPKGHVCYSSWGHIAHPCP